MARDHAAEAPAPDVKQDPKEAAEPTTPHPETPEKRSSSFMNFFASILGSKNPLAQPADPDTHTVWLLDNTAYQPVAADGASSPTATAEQPSWRAEVVACIFEREGRKDIGKLVATIADHIGLDGELGADEDSRQHIKQRVQPFLDQVAPSRTLTLEIAVDEPAQVHALGPSDRNGIVSQDVDLGAVDVDDGGVVRPQLQGFGPDPASMNTTFAAPEGWLVISDIDDTIKYTQTREPTGILRSTFADEPEPITGMPQFYEHIEAELVPAWFYLSASPYNLYPFLHRFLREQYPPGTLVLRDYAWMDVSGLIRSFTEKTHEYKVDRMEKIRRWFPRRRVLCIGDSTQEDPEAYADMYRRYPNWIHAIIIRKVTDVAHMEERNRPERFEQAFQDVPAHVWTIFEDTRELHDFVDGLGMEDQAL
ncbi:hypothetical protein NUU61_009051 [Penicillium alfredii]|uniref:Phosphatidate phosphatase APP1 catalytic domain-containing protein n=1 Tax=Penicillium alfredii TaxID=1506179 RepID=A0A9W9EMD3_9EURO|nr:uncharacterized protein NUU61_009051 [Penicillium alfredii]KAJ5084472.1 hypothetical protein NUU61_009051 [Penicillium alfredii]